MIETPCILVSLTHDDREFTVAAYNAVQRQREDQPLWARRVPPVEQLTTEPSKPYDQQIVDLEAYRAQMRVLIGLDPVGTSPPMAHDAL